MAVKQMESSDLQVDLLRKVLMIELFKLGVSQEDIGKKLKVQKVAVNSFLKGIRKGD